MLNNVKADVSGILLAFLNMSTQDRKKEEEDQAAPTSEKQKLKKEKKKKEKTKGFLGTSPTSTYIWVTWPPLAGKWMMRRRGRTSTDNIC